MGLHMSTPGFILLMAEFEGIDIELLHPSKPATHFPQWSMETAQLETSSNTNGYAHPPKVPAYDEPCQDAWLDSLLSLGALLGIVAQCSPCSLV